MRFIDAHKRVFGVEPICRVLTEHGMPVAPSTYYAARSRLPSPRAVRDEWLKAEISRVHRAGSIHEYSHAARSLSAVRWSRGLRAAMLGPSEMPEKTDVELAADDTNGELVTRFAAGAWSAMRLAGLDLALLAAAESGGDSAVHLLIAAASAQSLA